MKQSLTETFNLLKSAHPDLSGGATALDMGAWGLVADHHDGTVSKILFRRDNPQQQEWAEANLKNELAFLRLMGGHSLDGVQIPALVDDLKTIGEGEYFASYRMTKISGLYADWVEETNLPSDHFYEAGKVLAQFHTSLSPLDYAGLISHGEEKGISVAAVTAIDADRNAALAVVGSYLKEHHQPGVIHGDYHGRNILLNDRGRITGLLDFAVTGPAENVLLDLINVTSHNRSAFMDGYTKASGQAIDPVMMTMTEISLIADYINFRAGKPDQERWIRELDKHLHQVRDVTGYTPG